MKEDYLLVDGVMNTINVQVDYIDIMMLDNEIIDVREPVNTKMLLEALKNNIKTTDHKFILFNKDRRCYYIEPSRMIVQVLKVKSENIVHHKNLKAFEQEVRDFLRSK